LIVLDTTILVYAKGADHQLRGPCRRLLQAVERGTLIATTTPEAIQEFAHVRARRRDRADAVQLAAAYVDLLAPLLAIEEVHLREGLLLFERYPQLGSFDAVLAATTIATNAEALVSADGAFAEIPGLVHVDPGASSIESLMGG
jgi:uncharacterized protein